MNPKLPSLLPSCIGVYESPIFEGYWTWQGHRIRYHVSGAEGGDAVVLVHGFGGNADHWRKVRGLKDAAKFLCQSARVSS